MKSQQVGEGSDRSLYSRNCPMENIEIRDHRAVAGKYCTTCYRCIGCALYAHRGELPDAPITFRLIDEEGSNGHMTIVRKNGSQTVNEDTIRQVDEFLCTIPHR